MSNARRAKGFLRPPRAPSSFGADRPMGPNAKARTQAAARAPKHNLRWQKTFRVPRLRQAREPCARIRLHPLTESEGGTLPIFFQTNFSNSPVLHIYNTHHRSYSNAVFRQRRHANISAKTLGFRFRCIAALSRLTFDAIDP